MNVAARLRSSLVSQPFSTRKRMIFSLGRPCCHEPSFVKFPTTLVPSTTDRRDSSFTSSFGASIRQLFSSLPYGLLPCQTLSSEQLALMLGTKQMVNIGCGIKFKRHTLRTLLISFFHSRMADSQIRTAEKADLGDCGSAIPGSIWGTKTRKQRCWLQGAQPAETRTKFSPRAGVDFRCE